VLLEWTCVTRGSSFAAGPELAAMDASAAFAVAADLVLWDGRMERLEGRCLRRLTADLGLSQATARAILDVMRMKNGA